MMAGWWCLLGCWARKNLGAELVARFLLCTFCQTCPPALYFQQLSKWTDFSRLQDRQQANQNGSSHSRNQAGRLYMQPLRAPVRGKKSRSYKPCASSVCVNTRRRRWLPLPVAVCFWSFCWVPTRATYKRPEQRQPCCYLCRAQSWNVVRSDKSTH